MKKASIQQQTEKEIIVMYLYIPCSGNAPMLLLEFCSEKHYKFSTKVEGDFFRIHFNLDKAKIKEIRNFINNNL